MTEYTTIPSVPPPWQPGPVTRDIVGIYRLLQRAIHACDNIHRDDVLVDAIQFDETLVSLREALDGVGSAVLRLIGWAEPSPAEKSDTPHPLAESHDYSAVSNAANAGDQECIRRIEADDHLEGIYRIARWNILSSDHPFVAEYKRVVLDHEDGVGAHEIYLPLAADLDRLLEMFYALPDAQKLLNGWKPARNRDTMQEWQKQNVYAGSLDRYLIVTPTEAGYTCGDIRYLSGEQTNHSKFVFAEGLTLSQAIAGLDRARAYIAANWNALIDGKRPDRNNAVLPGDDDEDFCKQWSYVLEGEHAVELERALKTLWKQSQPIAMDALLLKLVKPQEHCKEDEPSLPDEWAACLDDPRLDQLVRRLRTVLPPPVTMVTIITALIRSWEMCSGQDKVEIITEALGIDEDAIGPHTIMKDKCWRATDAGEVRVAEEVQP